MFSIKVDGPEVIGRRLTSLKTALEGGMEWVSPQTIAQIDAIVREHDAAVFLRNARQDWERIKVPTWVFSREIPGIGKVKTLAQAVAAVASDLLPLMDTQRLFKSIATDNVDHIVAVVGQTTLLIGTSVPYAAKHWNGNWETFEFGDTEKARLDERFEMPVDGRDKERDYYRLRNWAYDRYPIRAWVPARSWFEPLSEEDQAKIAQILGDDYLSLL